MSVQFVLQHANGSQIVMVPDPWMPEGCYWRFPNAPHQYFVGENTYAQLVYAIETRPMILPTDPGPLDARVS